MAGDNAVPNVLGPRHTGQKQNNTTLMKIGSDFRKMMVYEFYHTV